MYTCSNCGYKSVKWLGKCPVCEAWETFVEEKSQDDSFFKKEKSFPMLLSDIKEHDFLRIKTEIEELDRILGGGLVEGEVILVGGEPGLGKSTLMLEVASKLSKKGKTLYVSAEESPQQITLRAKRLEGDFSNLYILGEDNVEQIYLHIKEENFKYLIIDSIQVMYLPKYEGPKGSATQVRGCAEMLTQIAKSENIVVFLIGHVTKEGLIAGPKLLEHIVDCVLYFESESLSNYRILRATKNRFGPTGDIAIFEMTSYGLVEVKKIYDIFLPHRKKAVSGSSVVCVIEGARPILVELQSLVGRAAFGMVRRRSLGFDFNRFSLLIAIIEKRLKISLSNEDVFLNVAGGLKITDPAADLGAVVSIISSFKEKIPKVKAVFMAEIGLAGELRRINNINLRLKEIERTNFKNCIISEDNLDEVDKNFNFLITGYSSLKDVIEYIFD
ncbi:MAG: DNA repair protein RadA [Candidatus Omnitrophica bacterium]|nr:DNA repair protein RadA [Candidatus Omnitrophota bacterium]